MKTLINNMKKTGLLFLLGLMMIGIFAPAGFAGPCPHSDHPITGGSIDTPG